MSFAKILIAISIVLVTLIATGNAATEVGVIGIQGVLNNNGLYNQVGITDGCYNVVVVTTPGNEENAFVKALGATVGAVEADGTANPLAAVAVVSDGYARTVIVTREIMDSLYQSALSGNNMATGSEAILLYQSATVTYIGA